MKTSFLENDMVPYFCWDRNLTVRAIRKQLAASTGFEWVRIASWIMREAAFADVWTFLTPAEIRDHLAELAPFLGRNRGFWEYIVGEWRELGRI